MSDKKGRANATVGVRYQGPAPLPSPYPAGTEQGAHKKVPSASFSPQVLHATTHLCRLFMCLPSFVEKEAASKSGSSCSVLGVQCPLLSSLWRWPGEETWSLVANVKPLIQCWKNISQGFWSRNCHLVSLVAVLSGAAAAALINVCSQCCSGQSKNTGLQYLDDLLGKV